MYMTYRHRVAQSVLSWFAKKIIRKYHPRIIGITGSVGKTSAKEAIAHVLASHFTLRKNEKNFNTEIGVPLTIIGIQEQPRGLLDWLAVVMKGWGLLVVNDRRYPALLVLEMGADHPGDIAQLTALAPCDIGVVTAIGPTHLEYFETVERVAKEKSILVTHLKKEGVAILNHDDALVFPMREQARARVVTYGYTMSAQVRALEYRAGFEILRQNDHAATPAEAPGTIFKLQANGAALPVRLPGRFGNPSVYAALAAAAVGTVLGLNLHEVSERLSTWPPIPGRLSLLKGVRNAWIIDDTYNSSSVAAMEALDLLGSQMPPGNTAQRWAVLGDMLELGAYTDEAHREVGAAVVAKGHADYLVTVGERARMIARTARKMGMPDERVYEFATAQEAGRFIQNRMEQGDLILVKGSRGMRMEQIVKELMAEPLRAKELLVQEH